MIYYCCFLSVVQRRVSSLLLAAVSLSLLGGCGWDRYPSFVEARAACYQYHRKMLKDPAWKKYFNKGIKNVRIYRGSCDPNDSGDMTLVWGYYDKDEILRVRKRFRY